MSPAGRVRDVLAAAGYIDSDLPVTVACRVIAQQIIGGASPQHVAELLDAHSIALENHPDTHAIAARLIAAVNQEND